MNNKEAAKFNALLDKIAQQKHAAELAIAIAQAAITTAELSAKGYDLDTILAMTMPTLN